MLDHVSFEVMAGETVCILGRSGVGKSVSLHHTMGFLKPDSGRVIVAGEDITDYTEEQLEHVRYTGRCGGCARESNGPRVMPCRIDEISTFRR